MPVYRVQRFIYNLSQNRFTNRFLDGFGGVLQTLRLPYAKGLTRNKAKMWLSENPQEVSHAENALLETDRNRAYHAVYKLGRNYFRQIDMVTPPTPEPAAETQTRMPSASEITTQQFVPKRPPEEPTGRDLSRITQMMPRMRKSTERGQNGAEVHKVSEETVLQDFRFQQAATKIILDDAKPATPEELRTRLGETAYQEAMVCLRQAIENKDKTPRISSRLERDILAVCREMQLEKMARMTSHYMREGYDLTFEDASATSVFYYWLSQAYKAEFFHEWTSASFNYERLTNLARMFYRNLISYHAARDIASERQLPALEEKYQRIATPRETFYADLLIKEKTKELSNGELVGEVLKGLAHECLAASGATKSNIDKLPNSSTKLKRFFKASNRQARKAKDIENALEAIMECLRIETSDSKYIRIAAFASASVLFGGINWLIRWQLSKGYIKDKKTERSRYMNRLAKSLETSGEITVAHTPEVDCYFYFRIHGTKDYYAPEEIRLDRETIAGLHRQFPDLIFAPESMIKYEPIPKQGYIAKGYHDHVEDLGMLSIREESAKYITENKIPLIFFDARIPSTVDTEALDKREEPFTARDWGWYGPPLVGGTLLAYLFTKNNGGGPKLSRRAFMGAVFGAGVAETVLNTKDYRKNWGPEKWLDPFTIQFRNALFAYKLLVWSRRYKEEHGKKPKVLVTFGAAHGDILKHLEKGEEYCLSVIRRLGNNYGYTRGLLGEDVHRAHRYDPTGKEKTKESVIEFPGLRAAIPR